MRAVKLAVTKRNVAKLLGVSPQTVSGWGRRHPIPRHVRPRLEEYVGLRRGESETVGLGHEVLAADRKLHQRIRDLLRSEKADDVGKLPPRYRERYRERLKEVQTRINEEIRGKLSEIAADVERELADFRARLVAEFRAQRRGST